MLWPFLLTLAGYALAVGPVALEQSDLPEPLPLLVMGIGLVWGFQVVLRQLFVLWQVSHCRLVPK